MLSFPFFPRRVVAALLISIAALASAHAQLEVDLKLSRRSYLLYEPLIATITVTNNAGREVTLQDEGGVQWLNIDITRLDGSSLVPYDANYKLRPLTIAAGQTLQRQIDITPLFPLGLAGTHRMRANIYFADADRYFYSKYVIFEMVNGRQVWRQDVGAPDGSGDIRQVSLMTLTLPDKLVLYARVRDEKGGTVYTTQSLGRVVMSGHEPEHAFDRNNVLHVLHESVPGSYVYTQISMNGERLDRQIYARVRASRPVLDRTPTGIVTVRGGQVQTARAEAVGGPVRTPKLSDRPVGLPLPPARRDGF